MNKAVNGKIDAFETDLKSTPRLTYPKYRAEVITWASNRCNESLVHPGCWLGF
jgi:hypothetical protein